METELDGLSEKDEEEETLITKEHHTIATIEIYNQAVRGEKFSGFLNYKTSGVNSGCQGGSSLSGDSREELIQKGIKAVEEHNIWCDSWYNEEEDKHYRKNEKYTSEIWVDGVKLPDPKSSSLNKWF